MARKGYQGSIILEILIVLLVILLVIVIYIPDKIWEEEEYLTNTCRNNINSIYEAERYYYRHTESYTDTLSKLITFIQTDSALQTRSRLVNLTRSTLHVLNSLLKVPTLSEVLTVSKSMDQMKSDLRANRRYFKKYENILETSQNLQTEINKINHSATFVNFSIVKMYVDSLDYIREHISDYPLQNAIVYIRSYADTIKNYLPVVEKAPFYEYWTEHKAHMLAFVDTINHTDIKTVSSVGDRLMKFLSRGDKAVEAFMNADLAADARKLDSLMSSVNDLHQRFLSTDLFALTQRYGLQKLNETDSILLSLNEENFTCPDANERYLIAFRNASITVECPNLLDDFQANLQQHVEPIRNLAVYSGVDSLQAAIDSMHTLLFETRTLYRRVSTDILLDIKEILNDMENMWDNIPTLSFIKDVQTFVDTVQTEKKISVLKPMIEEVTGSMDTLAVIMEQQNTSDIEEKINDLKEGIRKLDSTIAAAKLPRKVRKRVVEYSPAFHIVEEAMAQLKNSFDPADGQKLRQASEDVGNDLTRVMNGYRERVHVIFYKKHINHGYIKDRYKSWEEQR